MGVQLFERQKPWNEAYDVRVSEPNAAGDVLYLLHTSCFNQTCVGSQPQPSMHANLQYITVST